MWVELIEKYKTRKPSPTFVSPQFEEHPIYWILIRLIHLGAYETLEAVSAQVGLDPRDVSALLEAAKDANEDFPISNAAHMETREEIVRISPGSLNELRDAALSISPEHMPPPYVMAIKNGTKEKCFTELVFRDFRVDSKDVLPVVSSILDATPGLEDYRVSLSQGGRNLFVVQMPALQVLLLPVCGMPNDGYFADVREVLFLREDAYREANLMYALARTLPLIISTGFTMGAQNACLHEPKVLLVSLWAFLKLVGFLQVRRDRALSNQALGRMHDLMVEGGPGHFYPDGFVNRTINEIMQETAESPQREE